MEVIMADQTYPTTRPGATPALAADICTIAKELRRAQDPIRPQALASLLEITLSMHQARLARAPRAMEA
jgi:hypothetical protein